MTPNAVPRVEQANNRDIHTFEPRFRGDEESSKLQAVKPVASGLAHG